MQMPATRPATVGLSQELISRTDTMITHKARLIATLAAAIALQGAAQAQPQLSGTPGELRGFLFPRPHTVNISGDGEITTYKDQAKVSLMVTTEALDLYQSMKANQELRNKLTQDFISAGIPAGDINNSKFSSSPQFGFLGRDPSSYEVTARLAVEVESEEHLQLLAAAAVENDEVEFESTEFEHSAEETFEVQVRELALQDVMEQKAYYESNLGIKLQAINFFYGGVQRMSRAMPMVAMEMAADVASTAVQSVAAPAVAPTFDEVEYQTSVTVVFEIVSDN